MKAYWTWRKFVPFMSAYVINWQLQLKMMCSAWSPDIRKTSSRCWKADRQTHILVVGQFLNWRDVIRYFFNFDEFGDVLLGSFRYYQKIFCELEFSHSLSECFSYDTFICGFEVHMDMVRIECHTLR